MSISIERISDETLGVSFPYDASRVKAIKRLTRRRWNGQHKRWEVHIAHLADVIRIFNLSPGDVDESIRDLYRSHWADGRVEVKLTPLQGKLKGGAVPVGRIDTACSYFVPGYKFSPKYKAKRWDGQKHLFNVNQLTFPAGLWPRVREVLEAEGVEYQCQTETEDHAEAPRLGAAAIGKALRPYQEEALGRALEAGHGIIQIPTGGGKTLLAAHLIRRIDRPAFFFVHTLDLLYQSAAVFEEELGIEVGILGDGQANLRGLTVATVQTAARAFDGAPRRGRKLSAEDEEGRGGCERSIELDEASREEIRKAIDSAALVVFDECHHVPADTFYKLAMQTGSARWRYGLSATPWRDDEQDLLLEAALGPRVSATMFSHLIDDEYLVPPRIRILKNPMRMKRHRGLTYADCYSQAIVENQERNRVIATQARQLAESGRSVLILVAQVAHGQTLQNLLPEARFAHGAVEGTTRQQWLGDLERKLPPILIATTLADEGLDVPTLDCVILAGGGKSPTRAYQRIGRALRPAAGKTEALVLDFWDDVPYLREHSEARLDLYRQEERFLIELED